MCELFRKTDETGFSLLEVLIALAIMSVLSLALFQSTAQLLSVSDRSVRVSGKAVDDFTFRNTVQDVVQNLTPEWEENSEQYFFGQANGFRGLSTVETVVQNRGLTPVSLILQNDPSELNRYDLVLSASDLEVILKSDLSANTQFAYLGWDQIWYDVWPPADVPSTGYFDDTDYTDMPQLPLAVRISDEVSEPPFLLIASRRQTEYPPARQDNVAN